MSSELAMSTNHALLLSQDVEHTLDRLSQAWTRDSTSLLSCLWTWDSPRLGFESHTSPYPTLAVPDHSRKALKRATWLRTSPWLGEHGLLRRRRVLAEEQATRGPALVHRGCQWEARVARRGAGSCVLGADVASPSTAPGCEP